MIFFMAMPFLTGLINFVDAAADRRPRRRLPVLNSISLCLTVGGAALVMVSLVIGEFSTGGWSGYPPYTEARLQPGVGPDYWIWAVTLSSLGSMLTGINFAVTIYKMRAPGMTLMRMPLFTWTALCTSHPDDLRHAAADRCDTRCSPPTAISASTSSPMTSAAT